MTVRLLGFKCQQYKTKTIPHDPEQILNLQRKRTRVPTQLEGVYLHIHCYANGSTETRLSNSTGAVQPQTAPDTKRS